MQIEELKADVDHFKGALQKHPVFQVVKGVPELRIFASWHIFLVWDYMSLLKSLQVDLTYEKVPWIPLHTPYIRFLINSMVLKEESDMGPDGNYASHYEIYRQAIIQLKGEVSHIDDLLHHLREDFRIFQVIDLSNLPNPVKEFLEYTFWVVQKASLHEKAAVLCFGREGFGHHILLERVGKMAENEPSLQNLMYYLRKKTEVNDTYHSELSKNLLSELCGTDALKWKEAKSAANQALRNRIRLFDFIHDQVNSV